MTILIQTEEFELGGLYAHLNKKKLLDGVTVKLDRIEKVGRLSWEEVIRIFLKIGDIAWQEVVKEIVKYAFKKMLEVVLAKPHVEVNFISGGTEVLPHTMGESKIAARLIELVETGTVKSIRFNS